MTLNGPVQWDADGKPYQVTSGGQRFYLAPLVAAQYRDDPRLVAWAASQGVTLDPVTGQVTDEAPTQGMQWDTDRGQWQRTAGSTIDRIMAPAVLGGLGVAGLSAAGLFGGGAGVANAGIPQGVGPTTFGSAQAGTAAAGLPASLVAENAAGPLLPGVVGTGVLPTAPVGGASVAAPPASSIPSGVASAGGAGSKILDMLTSGEGVAAMAGLIGALTGGRGGGNNGLQQLIGQNPQLGQLLDISAGRAQRTDPLHAAITQLAMNRLPTSVQR